jgi:pimeloyl-ACP methyl ester carboxylesterase
MAVATQVAFRTVDGIWVRRAESAGAIDPPVIVSAALENELPRPAKCLPEINVPVLIIAGHRDRFVSLIKAEFLDDPV